MREIKFRGKRRDNGEWSYGYVCNCDIVPIDKYIENNFGWLEEQECYYCFKDSICQFSGLTDDNEKEIYEGDIVKVTSLDDKHLGKSIISEVLFECASFCFKKDNRYIPLLFHVGIDEVQVMGNIYDNPELLKKREERK